MVENMNSIHEEWTGLPELMKAIAAAKASLAPATYEARLEECIRVDRPGKKRTERAEWVSQTIRAGYLASIMLGRIHIGS